MTRPTSGSPPTPSLLGPTGCRRGSRTSPSGMRVEARFTGEAALSYPVQVGAAWVRVVASERSPE